MKKIITLGILLVLLLPLAMAKLNYEQAEVPENSCHVISNIPEAVVQEEHTSSNDGSSRICNLDKRNSCNLKVTKHGTPVIIDDHKYRFEYRGLSIFTNKPVLMVYRENPIPNLLVLDRVFYNSVEMMGTIELQDDQRFEYEVRPMSKAGMRNQRAILTIERV